MKSRIVVLVVAMLTAAAVAPTLAHEEFRIIGTITKMQNSQLEVKSREGRVVSMKLDGETLIYLDNTKVDAAELKAGRHVVVDALGDDYSDLLALEVRIIPALPR